MWQGKTSKNPKVQLGSSCKPKYVGQQISNKNLWDTNHLAKHWYPFWSYLPTKQIMTFPLILLSSCFHKNIPFTVEVSFLPKIPFPSTKKLTGARCVHPSACTLATMAAACNVTGAKGKSWRRAAQAVQETTGEAPGLWTSRVGNPAKEYLGWFGKDLPPSKDVILGHPSGGQSNHKMI